MSADPKTINEWIATVTRGLSPKIRDRLRIELASHYHDARADLLVAGYSEAEASQIALAALGDVHVTGATYREEYALEAPWLVTDVVPAKPADRDYGYLKDDELVACSREELIDLCRKPRQVSLAWTPESEKLLPVEQIPFLFKTIKEARITTSKDELYQQLMWVPLYFVWAFFDKGLAKQRPYMVLLLAWGLFLAVELFRRWRKSIVLTPESLVNEVEYWEAERWLSFGKARVCRRGVLLIAVVAVLGFVTYAATDVYGEVVGVSRSAFVHGQWWRVFTSLATPNMAGLIVVVAATVGAGRTIELLLGRPLLPLIFISSALFGVGVSMAISGETIQGPSAGAFGLLGFMVARRTHDRYLRRQRLVYARLILILAACGVVLFDALPNAAHLGGLIAGLVWGWTLKRPELFAQTKIARAVSEVLIACVVGGATGSIFILVHRLLF